MTTTPLSTKSNIAHVAIIMDGNGRWAQERGHRRIWGHIRGSRLVSSIVEEADRLKIKALTLYAFSTENWARPVEEVRTLFALLKKFIIMERDRIIRNNICFKIIGDISALPRETRELISGLEESTRHFSGLKLTFAFSYGSRDEIVKAVNRFILENPGKEIGDADLSKFLMTAECGDVDLLIRTGGDQRMSNFLLWQSAYAELFFTPTMWPDFTAQEFARIIGSVATRERRFGLTTAGAGITQSVELADKNKSFFKTFLRS